MANDIPPTPTVLTVRDLMRALIELPPELPVRMKAKISDQPAHVLFSAVYDVLDDTDRRRERIVFIRGKFYTDADK